MKKIFNYIFSLALGTILFTSCDLETIPTTSVDAGSAFSTTENADKVLNGSWAYLMETFNSYANPGYAAMLGSNDMMGSDAVWKTKTYGYGNQYAFTAIFGKGGTNTLSWALIYKIVNNCNGVIAYVDQAVGKEEDRNRIKGQAFALRGFMYLHLASCYSFAIDKDPNAVCGPIYLKPSDGSTEGEPASSVSEVYEQSISDFKEALNLIPEGYKRSSKHKIDRQVTLGLLSRSCLYARKWDEARKYSNDLLALNNYIMTEEEYKSGFSNVANKEWIWGHPQTVDQSNASYHFYYMDTTSGVEGYNAFFADPYFRDLFDDGDFRKEMLYWAPVVGVPPTANGFLWMNYSKFQFRDKSTELADIVLMRVSEIYLINAEAKARLNDPDAVNKLNELKASRSAKLAETTLSGQALLDAIWLERRKELWGEGFSLIDIIRNQQTVVRKEYPGTLIDYTYTDKNNEPATVKMSPQGHYVRVDPDSKPFTPNSKYYLYRITNAEELANPILYSKYPKLSIY